MTADFAAIITQTVTEGRALAESLMTATGIARRATGATTVDANDSDIPVYADLYTSKCKIQARNLQARQQEVGGRTATTVALELHLPVAMPKLTTGDVWEVLTSSQDPQLPGRRFAIVAPFAKEYATARRYEIEEVVA